MYDAGASEDLRVEYSLGETATSVQSVYLDNVTASYTIDGSSIVMVKETLKSLVNGSHSLLVKFDNNDLAEATVLVVNSNVGITPTPGENTTLPDNGVQVLDTMTYKFYKDYPSDIRIPLTTIGNVGVASVSVGSTEINSDDFKCEKNTVTINGASLASISEGAYGVVAKSPGGLA